MKIGVAQTRPVKGNIQANIYNHKKLIDLAISNGAEAIFFPELSLTGYEPGLSKELATDQNDNRFGDFQTTSDANQIIIGVGMPLNSDSGVLISMIIFQPGKPRQTYSKQYLHPDELPIFTNGKQQVYLTVKKKISPAICYELSVPEHADNASKNGAEIYLASVAKTPGGAQNAIKCLSGIANKYSMLTLMSNCVGLCDGFECGGQTAIWNEQGVLAGQLEHTCEGILIIDSETGELIKKWVE